ncbi:DUF7662 domain-containing protein [Pseudorhodoplanes sinuspersici]|uniref:DUF7662 domain-containing protein n=1 Tax=Pseudorhodoplanes sinuspersici TaxID=1235591 RepID=A0A1W6ZWT6_9HYPH|nr:hypothetical protein [Pseudorhodoplanes sinuspersici]ARQ01776.1 hypothetical protein CAK95_23765 [Pseudorhodoplanes sinuspersici]RKE73525.1 hypothetical protein DFP91_1414 [Pseudorhodoplanes sinuspersici]
MGKYEPLAAFLKKQGMAEVRMTFDQIERLIGGKLPASATEHRAWWSNNPSNSVITRAWLDAGYRTEDVDMVSRKLVFRKATRAHDRMLKDADIMKRPAISPRHPLYGSMKGLVTLAPGVDLTEPADPDWGKAYD